MAQTLKTSWVSLALLLSISLPGTADAWGDKGHRLIGYVAQGLLSLRARAGITEIMGSHDLATFSLHLDKHKNDLDRRIPGSRKWHYDNVPVCKTKAYPDYCPHGNCASMQIPNYYRFLADTRSSTNAKQFAIFALTHLIGDIHQPLHAADNDDRGGNEIKIELPDGRRLNLHSAWDTSFIEGQYRGKNELDIAKSLRNKYETKMTLWKRGTASEWIKETHGIGKEVAYGLLPGFRCGAKLGGRVDLPSAYVNKAEAVVEEQIAKAGYRLAWMLDRAFGE